jgi:hypothetical protein
MSTFAERLQYLRDNQEDLSKYAGEICKGNVTAQANAAFCRAVTQNLDNLSIHQVDMLYYRLMDSKSPNADDDDF